MLWTAQLGAWALMSAIPAAAQEPTWYQIEVIVFAHRDAAGAASERWPTDPGMPAAEAPVELASSDTAVAVDTEAAMPPPSPHGAEAAAGANPMEPGAGAEPAMPENTQTLDAVESLGLRAFVRLPDEELQLVNVRQRLNNSAGYRTLAHVGWRQPLVRNEKPQPVHIHSNADENTSPVATIPVAPPPLEAIESSASGLDEPAAPIPPPARPLDGTIAVVLGRYLHVTADLLYSPDTAPAATALPPSSPPSPEAMTPAADIFNEAPLDTPTGEPQALPPPTAPVYRMTQSRRMRSNELHYLDHPLFGVLVQATPVKVGNP